MKKIPVGILGATGLVGQQYVRLLHNHPWFKIAFLASSENSSGKTYHDAVITRWKGSDPIPSIIAKMPVYSVDEILLAKAHTRCVFSALKTEAAQLFEERYAKEGFAVISSASCHRMNPDVPLLIPEINPDHTQLISYQQKNRGYNEGFIVAKPNCTLQSYLLPLYPLHQKWKIKKAIVTTFQAVSGAGYPGIASLDILDNVIPYIDGEEEKAEQEPKKILGSFSNGCITSYSQLELSAHCNRVPVEDGHLACISVSFDEKPNCDEMITLWEDFNPLSSLPSSPKNPILYHHEIHRPQPKLDRLHGNGMTVSVGRLRPCSVLDYRFVALSHNILRGAAGGGVLIAELLKSQQYLPSYPHDQEKSPFLSAEDALSFSRN